MATKHVEKVARCDKWSRQHFHTIYNDSRPNAPDVETCSQKSLCNCCGEVVITGKEPWNIEQLHGPESLLCEPCHWCPAIRFDQCTHDGTQAKYMAYIRGTD